MKINEASIAKIQISEGMQNKFATAGKH